jgi:DNA-binding MarR family transcriptional regulator
MSNRAAPPLDDSAWAILSELQTFTRRLSRRWPSVVPDVTFVELLLLRTIADEEQATVRSVAEVMGIDKSTASRQVSALDRRGLIARRPIPGERRAQALRLTARGERLMRDADDVNLRAIVERLTDWPSEDVQVFAALLRRFNEESTGSS